MQLEIIEGNRFSLDGGAMFGNAPKALWQKWTKVDEDNRIPLASRVVLLRDTQVGNILFDAGIGNFFESKLLFRYGVQKDEPTLIYNLEKLGLSPKDIHHVFLTHLHFDHIGGLFSRGKEGISLFFDKATFHVAKRQWQRAQNPYPRDQASYIPELLRLLESSQRLQLFEKSEKNIFSSVFSCFNSDGHTPGLTGVNFTVQNKTYYFPSDLLPGKAWAKRAITMGYDCHADQICIEKAALVKQIAKENAYVIFGHDPDCAVSKITVEQDGKWVLSD